MEWTKDQYNKQYEKWVPWLEDLYLRYFTKDNKASYTAKENLDKTKVTGIDQVDTLLDGVHGLVAGQVGQGGLAQPIVDLASREGINRAERGGKDNKGSYVPSEGTSAIPGGSEIAGAGNAVVGGIAKGGQQVAGSLQSGMLGFQRQQKPQ